MKISTAGIQLIQKFEGLRLEAYQDSVGVWTIGYGHTKDVKPGQKITSTQATVLLVRDLEDAEAAVNALVTVSLTQGQFDALVSFVFNVGRKAFADSTLLKKLNVGDDAGAKAEFARWNHAGGKVLSGLTARREAEAEMFGNVATIERHDTPTDATAAIPVTPKTGAKPVLPFIAAALPSLIQAVPDLIKIFGDSSTPAVEKNAVAAQKVVDIAMQATGATNAQEMAERVSSDPAAAEAVRTAVKQQWFDLVDVGGGIPAARAFIKASPDFVPIMRTVTYSALGFLLLANLIVIGMLTGVVLQRPLEGWQQLLGIVIQADVGAATIALGFWLGSSLAKPRLEDK